MEHSRQLPSTPQCHRKPATRLPSPHRHHQPPGLIQRSKQTLLVLAYLRKGKICADLAIGFDIVVTTMFRYIREALGVLSAREEP
ncbi:transposase family protein [Actinopolyspora erythraea]|uniref:transposase family protein n=1 Tax=Actinopolyspora erythraea TaxID=414996 RepID=UPI0031B5C70E